MVPYHAHYGNRFRDTPPAAGSPREEIKAAWEIERKRIIAARFRAKREAEERGENFVFAAGEPPIDPPPWWRTDSGAAAVTPLTAPPEAATDPSKIELRWGVLGRPRQHPAGEGQDTPEQIFKRASLRDRAKAIFGVQLHD